MLVIPLAMTSCMHAADGHGYAGHHRPRIALRNRCRQICRRLLWSWYLAATQRWEWCGSVPRQHGWHESVCSLSWDAWDNCLLGICHACHDTQHGAMVTINSVFGSPLIQEQQDPKVSAAQQLKLQSAICCALDHIAYNAQSTMRSTIQCNLEPNHPCFIAK